MYKQLLDRYGSFKPEIHLKGKVCPKMNIPSISPHPQADGKSGKILLSKNIFRDAQQNRVATFLLNI